MGAGPMEAPGGTQKVQPGMSLGGQPSTRERQMIWKGVLEWKEELRDEQEILHSVSCTVSTSKANGVPEVKPDNWPAKLSMQLIPRTLVQTFGRNSKSVLFHPNECKSLDALTKVMGIKFAGCVHFTGVQACDIKVLILVYSNDKKTYLGYIPNDQVNFGNKIRTVIQQQKTEEQVRDQGQMRGLQMVGGQKIGGQQVAVGQQMGGQQQIGGQQMGKKGIQHEKIIGQQSQVMGEEGIRMSQTGQQSMMGQKQHQNSVMISQENHSPMKEMRKPQKLIMAEKVTLSMRQCDESMIISKQLTPTETKQKYIQLNSELRQTTTQSKMLHQGTTMSDKPSKNMTDPENDSIMEYSFPPTPPNSTHSSGPTIIIEPRNCKGCSETTTQSRMVCQGPTMSAKRLPSTDMTAPGKDSILDYSLPPTPQEPTQSSGSTSNNVNNHPATLLQNSHQDSPQHSPQDSLQYSPQDKDQYSPEGSNMCTQTSDVMKYIVPPTPQEPKRRNRYLEASSMRGLNNSSTPQDILEYLHHFHINEKQLLNMETKKLNGFIKCNRINKETSRKIKDYRRKKKNIETWVKNSKKKYDDSKRNFNKKMADVDEECQQFQEGINNLREGIKSNEEELKILQNFDVSDMEFVDAPE